ncbi:MAG: hypothetical protein Q9178_000777 [Gyalolechia marmorata]
MFRPHTARCTCPKKAGELETSVIDRGQFETWSWYANSVIPIQAPKMIHINCLHLMRPLTQPGFGLTLHARSLVSLEDALKQFKEDPRRLPVAREEAGLVHKRDTFGQADAVTVMA